MIVVIAIVMVQMLELWILGFKPQYQTMRFKSSMGLMVSTSLEAHVMLWIGYKKHLKKKIRPHEII